MGGTASARGVQSNGGRCRHRPPHVPALTAVAGWRGHLSLGGFGIASRREAPAAFPGFRSKAIRPRSVPPGSRERPEGPSPIPVGSRAPGQARPSLPCGIRRGLRLAGSRARLEAGASQVALRSAARPKPPRFAGTPSGSRPRRPRFGFRARPESLAASPPPPPGGDSPGLAGVPGPCSREGAPPRRSEPWKIPPAHPLSLMPARLPPPRLRSKKPASLGERRLLFRFGWPSVRRSVSGPPRFRP